MPLTQNDFAAIGLSLQLASLTTLLLLLLGTPLAWWLAHSRRRWSKRLVSALPPDTQGLQITMDVRVYRERPLNREPQRTAALQALRGAPLAPRTSALRGAKTSAQALWDFLQTSAASGAPPPLPQPAAPASA